MRLPIEVSRSAVVPAPRVARSFLRSKSAWRTVTASSPILICSALLRYEDLQIGEFDLGRVEAALGQRERDLVGLRVDVEQRIADLDLLPLDHVDRDDRARDLRRDQRLVRADIGIVGRDVAAAVQPPAEAERERDERDDDEHDEAPGPAALALDGDRRLRGRRRRWRLRRGACGPGAGVRAGVNWIGCDGLGGGRARRLARARLCAERQRLRGWAGGVVLRGSRAAAGLGWLTLVRLPQSIRS